MAAKPASPQVDLTEFYRLSRPKKPPCKVGHAREQLKPKERRELDAALALDPGVVTNDAIAVWLGLPPRGHEVTLSAVIVHRKTVTGTATSGKCSCGDEGR